MIEDRRLQIADSVLHGRIRDVGLIRRPSNLRSAI